MSGRFAATNSFASQPLYASPTIASPGHRRACCAPGRVRNRGNQAAREWSLPLAICIVSAASATSPRSIDPDEDTYSWPPGEQSITNGWNAAA